MTTIPTTGGPSVLEISESVILSLIVQMRSEFLKKKRFPFMYESVTETHKNSCVIQVSIIHLILVSAPLTQPNIKTSLLALRFSQI